MFYVCSRLRQEEGRSPLENGKLGPFEQRSTAERALIALCQAGRATSGEITGQDTSPVSPLVEAAREAQQLNGD